MAAPSYNREFMQYAAQSSAYSAGIITSYLAASLDLTSVLDVGCASGTWLRAWIECGVADAHGVDGDYVDRTSLQMPQAQFTAVDLNRNFDLGRQFDLVQSLEVAEHIMPEAADHFADSLARHARRFLFFSAAPPGQGGENHVNEQPYDYWRSALSRHGFVAIDAVRPAIAGDDRISYWYRYNSILYARQSALQKLDGGIRSLIIPEGTPIADVAPLAFRIRREIVRRLPTEIQNRVARFKARFAPTGRI